MKKQFCLLKLDITIIDIKIQAIMLSVTIKYYKLWKKSYYLLNHTAVKWMYMIPTVWKISFK